VTGGRLFEAWDWGFMIKNILSEGLGLDAGDDTDTALPGPCHMGKVSLFYLFGSGLFMAIGCEGDDITACTVPQILVTDENYVCEKNVSCPKTNLILHHVLDTYIHE
jgi:hypothetical protein